MTKDQERALAAKRSKEMQAKVKAENLEAQLISALITIDQRFRLCAEAGASAAEAYDSFYQEIVRESIANAKATGTPPPSDTGAKTP